MTLHRLHPRLQDYVKDKRWTDLTPIQKKAFDPIYQGISCTIEAPTSGGKTEAVLFPLLTRLEANKVPGIKILYIAPLKALLNDLAIRVIPYAKMCYKEAFKWHGDVAQSEKIQQIKFPSDILLTTPESVEAILLRKGHWVEVFQNLETFVIDEAHYFALTDRGSHLISLLERLEEGIQKRAQRIAVTATIGNPHELLAWMTSNRPGGQIIRAERINEKQRDFKIHYFPDDGLILQNNLYALLKQKKSIVFERSRSETENTASQINERNLNSQSRLPIKVKTHHSSVSKRLREEAESSIKQETETSVDAIISTSTLELGIDIGDLDQVIQIGGLNSSGSFLQRVGRTGRRPGRPQCFRGLCADKDELILLAACVNLGFRHISECILFPKKAFHILAHQIICICLQKNGATENSIWQILSKSHCFSKISHEEYDRLINHMTQEEYLRKVAFETIVTGDRTETQFLRANWKRLFAIFDTGPIYDVIDGKKIIGTLDSAFAQMRELPFLFILGGQEWKALKIDHETQQVLVEKNNTGKAPKWKAIANFDIPFELAQEVGRLLMNKEELEFLDHNASLALQTKRVTYHNLNWNNNKWILDSSAENSEIYLWTFAGDKINRALATLFLAKTNTKTEYDYMKVIVDTHKNGSLTQKDIYKMISDLKSIDQHTLESLCEPLINPNWFSKFSDCLPPELAQKTICEKSMDLKGLVRELTRICLENQEIQAID